MVKILRESFKDIPIFCLTNVEITEKLKKSQTHFNLILSRGKFDLDIDNYLNLFIRSGVSFYTEFKKELTKLGELSIKIAEGEFTTEDLEEMQALQTRLIIPHLTEELLSREKYLEELEKKITDVKSQQESLIQFLKKK